MGKIVYIYEQEISHKIENITFANKHVHNTPNLALKSTSTGVQP